jgi:hypothetical protein
MEPTQSEPVKKRRRYAQTLAAVGLGVLLLPFVLGRPPIGQAEANLHRLLMTGFIVSGAATMLAGYVALYLIDHSDVPRQGEDPPKRIPE